MTISEALLPEFDQEMASTRRVLERVPDDDPQWKPHPKSVVDPPGVVYQQNGITLTGGSEPSTYQPHHTVTYFPPNNTHVPQFH